MKFIYAENATPINQNEIYNLIPSGLITQKDLDVFEQKNIKKAEEWLFSNRNKKQELNDIFIKRIHKRMFDQTWKWAGEYRTTNMNIGTDWQKIPQEMIYLCDDCKYQIENKVYDIDEIAIRFSHRFVSIHPFQNGNGRCSRLLADWIVHVNGRNRFSWGSENLTNKSGTRDLYIKALKKADNNEIEDLIKFARS